MFKIIFSHPWRIIFLTMLVVSAIYLLMSRSHQMPVLNELETKNTSKASRFDIDAKDAIPGTRVTLSTNIASINEPSNFVALEGLVLAPVFSKASDNEFLKAWSNGWFTYTEDGDKRSGLFCDQLEEKCFKYSIFSNGEHLGGVIITSHYDLVKCLGYKGNKSFHCCIDIVEALQGLVTIHLEKLGLQGAKDNKIIDKAFTRLFLEIYNPELVSFNEYYGSDDPKYVEWIIDQELLVNKLKNFHFPKLPEYKVETQLLDFKEANNIDDTEMNKVITELGIALCFQKEDRSINEYIDDLFKLLLKDDGSPFASFLIIKIQGAEKDNFSKIIIGECCCDFAGGSAMLVYDDGTRAKGSEQFEQGHAVQSRIVISTFGVNAFEDGGLDKLLYDNDLGIINKFLLESVNSDASRDLLEELFVQKYIRDYNY